MPLGSIVRRMWSIFGFWLINSSLWQFQMFGESGWAVFYSILIPWYYVLPKFVV
jgi:hypothetical protein